MSRPMSNSAGTPGGPAATRAAAPASAKPQIASTVIRIARRNSSAPAVACSPARGGSSEPRAARERRRGGRATGGRAGAERPGGGRQQRALDGLEELQRGARDEQHAEDDARQRRVVRGPL